MARLKSCSYCGRIHANDYTCQQKADAEKKRMQKFKATNKDRFRWTKAWQDKREEIKERDLCLCMVCRDKGRYVYDNLSCHHIEPLEERFELRLENENLITLCATCHEDAEKGTISKEYLKELVEKYTCDNV